MSAKEILKEYESKINSHKFEEIVTLISTDASFWFSNGTFRGLNQIQAAFDKTWNLINNEVYWLTDVEWISEEEKSAACIYTFHWKGIIEGNELEGSGRGTSVFRKEADRWKIVHEHLSNFPK